MAAIQAWHEIDAHRPIRRAQIQRVARAMAAMGVRR